MWWESGVPPRTVLCIHRTVLGGGGYPHGGVRDMGRGDDIIAVMFMSRKKVVAVLAVLGIAGGFLWWWNVDGQYRYNLS